MPIRQLYASSVARGWLLFFVFLIAWLCLTYDRGFNLFDEGNAIYPAVLIMDGALPHLDFLTLYTGGVYYLYALLFSIFGVDIGIIRLALAILIGTLAVITIQLAARFMPYPWSFLPGIVFLLCFPLNPTAYHSWYAVVCHIIMLAAVFCYLETSARRWLFLAGLSAGAAFLAKQTMGVFSLTALMAFLLWSFPVLSTDRYRWADRLLRGISLGIIALVYTLFLDQSEYTRLHEKYVYLAAVWCLPFTLLPGLPSDPSAKKSSKSILIESLMISMAGFLCLPLIYAVYFGWYDGFQSLVYGVFQRPGQFLTVWVSNNQFPRLNYDIQAPMGALLFLLIWPLQPVTRHWRNPFIRYGIWILPCAFLLIYYSVPLVLTIFSLAASFSGLLSWANYTLFFSLIYYSPVLVPWLALILLIAARYHPQTVGLTISRQRGLAAVYIGHVFLFFCVYPMRNGMYLTFMMPTTLLMLTIVIHRLWSLSSPKDIWAFGWGRRSYHALRLVSLLAMPLIMAGAFLIWGTQYWIGLKHLGQRGQITWDTRVNLPLPRGDWGFSLKPEEAEPIIAVCEYIMSRTNADEPVFVGAGTGPLLLFLSERHTPSRVLFPMVTPDEVDAIPASIEHSRASYAVLDWNHMFEDSDPLQKYIATHYHLEKEIGEYRIFKRHP